MEYLAVLVIGALVGIVIDRAIAEWGYPEYPESDL
jgi:hypothetical protein